MPVYLLLPESALLMDRLGQKALLVTNRKAVESLRLSFSRQYFDASSVLRLTSGKHDFSSRWRCTAACLHAASGAA